MQNPAQEIKMYHSIKCTPLIESTQESTLSKTQNRLLFNAGVRDCGSVDSSSTTSEHKTLMIVSFINGPVMIHVRLSCYYTCCNGSLV